MLKKDLTKLVNNLEENDNDEDFFLDTPPATAWDTLDETSLPQRPPTWNKTQGVIQLRGRGGRDVSTNQSRDLGWQS